MVLPSTREVATRTSRMLLSTERWRSRLVLWAGSAAVGAAAVAFAQLADLAQHWQRQLLALWHWSPWVLAPLGFALVSTLTRRYFRGAEGSGIPQTIFALEADAGDAGARTAASGLLRLHVAVGRMLLAAAGLLCGGSIGREGPSVHVGAILTRFLSRLMPNGGTPAQRHALVLAGGAAGVAAAFNTPIAGIVFAIEELSHSFEERASGATLTAVILAGVLSIALVGDYTYFGQPRVSVVPGAFAATTLSVAIAG
ncbi:MAG TPA: chloride channel protein, partial [Steroidobacteraceae bacterium]|nr:chloride channel protein [Steroidobacteraceae bacterium]